MAKTNTQFRMDPATAARFIRFMADEWRRTGVRPVATRIVSDAVNAWLAAKRAK